MEGRSPHPGGRPPETGPHFLCATQFKTRWEATSAKYGWGPLAAIALPKAELRRLLLEFFAYGIDHRQATLRRLEELLPDRSAERLDEMGS